MLLVRGTPAAPEAPTLAQSFSAAALALRPTARLNLLSRAAAPSATTARPVLVGLRRVAEAAAAPRAAEARALMAGEASPATAWQAVNDRRGHGLAAAGSNQRIWLPAQQAALHQAAAASVQPTKPAPAAASRTRVGIVVQLAGWGERQRAGGGARRRQRRAAGEQALEGQQLALQLHGGGGRGYREVALETKHGTPPWAEEQWPQHSRRSQMRPKVTRPPRVRSRAPKGAPERCAAPGPPTHPPELPPAWSAQPGTPAGPLPLLPPTQQQGVAGGQACSPLAPPPRPHHQSSSPAEGRRLQGKMIVVAAAPSFLAMPLLPCSGMQKRTRQTSRRQRNTHRWRRRQAAPLAGAAALAARGAGWSPWRPAPGRRVAGQPADWRQCQLRLPAALRRPRRPPAPERRTACLPHCWRAGSAPAHGQGGGAARWAGDSVRRHDTLRACRCVGY